MFGRDRKVKIEVPGTPVVVIENEANRLETEATLKHNAERKEANIDKTVADSFPASDPPSTTPETKETTKQRPEDKKVA